MPRTKCQCMKYHWFLCLGVGVLGLGKAFIVLGFGVFAFCHWRFVPRSSSYERWWGPLSKIRKNRICQWYPIFVGKLEFTKIFWIYLDHVVSIITDELQRGISTGFAKDLFSFLFFPSRIPWTLPSFSMNMRIQLQIVYQPLLLSRSWNWFLHLHNIWQCTNDKFFSLTPGRKTECYLVFSQRKWVLLMCVCARVHIRIMALNRKMMETVTNQFLTNHQNYIQLVKQCM